MPRVIHAYDIAEFDGKIFVAGNTVWMSKDRGATMQVIGSGTCFLQFKNNLFSTSLVPFRTSNNMKVGVGKYNKSPEVSRFERVQLERDVVLPDTPQGEGGTQYAKLSRPALYKDEVFYLAGYPHNDHQSNSFGVYAAKEQEPAFVSRRISLPPNAEPHDLKVRNGKILILFSLQDGENVVNYVWSSPDGVTFMPLLSFKATTFARSMEYFNGSLYFGMGTDVADKGSCNPQTGAPILNWDIKEFKHECGEIYRLSVKRCPRCSCADDTSFSLRLWRGIHAASGTFFSLVFFKKSCNGVGEGL